MRKLFFMRNFCFVLWSLVLCAPLACAGAAPSTQYFRVTQRHGVWWLVDPAGHRFISKGVDNTGFFPTPKHTKAYGLPAKQSAVAQLLRWGFNTTGAFGDKLVSISVHGRGMDTTPILWLGSRFTWQYHYSKQFPDVFSPQFKVVAYRSAKEQCAKWKNNPRIIGWYSDNELRWAADWRGKNELLTIFLNYPATSPGHRAAVALLRRRYHGRIASFDRIWKQHFKSWRSLDKASHIAAPYLLPLIWARSSAEAARANKNHPGHARFVADCNAFLGLVAARYYRICRGAIKSADPNHLYLGAKDAYVPPTPVLRAEIRYCDVLSIDNYSLNPGPVLKKLAATGKPIIIAEFSIRARDSGLPNTKGAGPLVNTQAQRAAAMSRYVTLALKNPNVVGYSWFEYVDEPKKGRSLDGENSNYGLLTRAGKPYRLLIDAFQRVNAKAKAIHVGAGGAK